MSEFKRTKGYRKWRELVEIQLNAAGRTLDGFRKSDQADGALEAAATRRAINMVFGYLDKIVDEGRNVEQ